MNLRELTDAATRGPWVVQYPEPGCFYVDSHGDPDGPEPVLSERFLLGEPDAAAIAAWRSAVPLLLDILDAARWAAITLNDFVAVGPRGSRLDGPPAIIRRLRDAIAAFDRWEAER